VAAIVTGVTVAVSPSRPVGPADRPTASASATPAITAPTGVPPGWHDWGDQWRPPLSSDAVPATVDPSVVGADPGLFHFDVDQAAVTTPVVQAQWMSLSGLEQLVMQAGPSAGAGNGPRLMVSRDRAQLDPLGPDHMPVRVGAKPATLSVQDRPSDQVAIFWQPLPGVWAEVIDHGEQIAIRFAEGVRFDHVRRCAVPFRLTWVPSGTRLLTCSVLFGPTTGITASATVGTSRWQVVVDILPDFPAISGTMRINGRPAQASEYPGDGGALTYQVDVDYGDHTVDLQGTGHYSKATILHVAQGYQDLPGGDPTTWPASPLD
jgi:hypothetical protein